MKPKPVWVNLIRFETLAMAARYVSKQINGEVLPWQVQAAMEGGYPMGGMWIRDARPAGINREPLLNYPPDETPLNRGLPERWR